MITTLLDEVCSATGHRFAWLCAYVVRDERFWRGAPTASECHRKLRTTYLDGISDLPFVPKPPTTAHQVIARDRRDARDGLEVLA